MVLDSHFEGCMDSQEDFHIDVNFKNSFVGRI